MEEALHLSSEPILYKSLRGGLNKFITTEDKEDDPCVTGDDDAVDYVPIDDGEESSLKKNCMNMKILMDAMKSLNKNPMFQFLLVVCFDRLLAVKEHYYEYKIADIF